MTTENEKVSKKEQLLMDKEDEYDDLFDSIAENYREHIDWLDDNVADSIDQIQNAQMHGDFRDAVSTLEDCKAEIDALIQTRNRIGDKLDKLETLEDEIHELRREL
jgi:transcription termination factor NusB